jgi:predicted esterase
MGGASGAIDTRPAAADASDASAPEAVPSPTASVVESPGCGRGGRPAGGVVAVEDDHIYTFPASYDGETPLPVVFGFHANNNPIDQIQSLTARSPLPTNYVMVFPKSVGNGWAIGTDSARLDGWYRDLLDNYCVDESRIFATGHSSGAQFIVQLLCRGESRFKAVAPVASSRYCASWGPIPTLLIHGRDDRERANTNQDADGRQDLEPYLASNNCGMETSSHPVSSCTSGGVSVDPGCRLFAGCSAPLIWCSHDDPSYANTNHGWPCFASQAMFDFFQSLP